MRKPFNLFRTGKIIFGIVCILTLVIYSCRRQFDTIRTTVIDAEKARFWLHENGLQYRNETIVVMQANGEPLIGKLNWQKARQYPWNGNDYIDVPYEFKNYGAHVPGRDATAPAGFNLVLRKKGDGFEGALRTIMYDAPTQNTQLDSSRKTIQRYELLDGRPANIWLSSKPADAPVAAKEETVSAVEFANRQLQYAKKMHPGTGKPGERLMLMQTTCTTTHVITYTSHCNDPAPDGENVVVTICRHEYYIITCETTDVPGSGGGGEGDSYPPAPTNPPSNEPPKQDPCAEAKKKADSIALALNDPAINAHLEQFITDYKNSSVEHGFIISKNADGSYSFSDTKIGDGTHIDWTYPGNLNIVALVHVHPPGASAIPSPTDIYGLNNYTNASFAGSIVISGDERYMVSITDAVKYAKFAAKKKEYYDSTTQSQWKKKSMIYDDLYEFIENAKGIYTQGADLMFPAQLYLMKELNMGVSLQEWDGSVFKPKATIASPNTSTGSGTTIGGGGQVISSKYTSITVGPDC